MDWTRQRIFKRMVAVDELGVTSWPRTIPIEETDKNKPIIDLLSLHDIKYDEKGKMSKAKLRPCARGDQMHEGSFESIYSATVGSDATRLVYSICAASGKVANGLDVSTAYLYGKLRPQDTAYCYVPKFIEYFDGVTAIPQKLIEEWKAMSKKERKLACKPDRSKVIEIYRPVYGIPSAGQRWWVEYATTMRRKWKMRQCAVDSCVYYKKEGKDWLIAATFVDDVTYFGTDSMCKWFEEMHQIGDGNNTRNFEDSHEAKELY